MVIKFNHYALLFILALFVSGCSTQPVAPTQATSKATPDFLKPPTTDCEIRKWYNYQVVAIPLINKRWIDKGLTAEQRAQKAFTLRHNARINARYMMPNQEEVKALQVRDQKKYGNPDGPTFAYLVKKHQKKGLNGKELYQSIIKSSSRTDSTYNEQCEK